MGRLASPSCRVLPVVLAAVASVSCGAGPGGTPPIVQPGAPGGSSRVITPAEATDVSPVQPTAADVRFMQRMIGHHAQALEMTALVPSRTEREDIRLLTRRLEVSQEDEITFMREWLGARGAPVPDAHAHHQLAPSERMPGMLAPEEMARLAAASGTEFERLFLEGMIKHHEGALVMVQEAPGHAGGRSGARRLRLHCRRGGRSENRDRAHERYARRSLTRAAGAREEA